MRGSYLIRFFMPKEKKESNHQFLGDQLFLKSMCEEELQKYFLKSFSLGNKKISSGAPTTTLPRQKNGLSATRPSLPSSTRQVCSGKSPTYLTGLSFPTNDYAYRSGQTMYLPQKWLKITWQPLSEDTF